MIRRLTVLVLIVVVTLGWLPTASSQASEAIVVGAPDMRGRKDKDDDKKGAGNYDKYNEQQGTPRNTDKGPQKQKAEDKRRVETNNLNDDSLQIEGQVLATMCKRNPKEVIIGSLDGEVVLRLHPRRFRNGFEWEGEVRCDDLIPGDYIYVHEAEKVNEYLYEVYQFRCQKDNVGPQEDNVDYEDSCPHNPIPPELRDEARFAPDGARFASLAPQGLSFRLPQLPAAVVVQGDNDNGDEPGENENQGSASTAPPPTPAASNEDEGPPPGWKPVVIQPNQAGVLTSDNGRVSISVEPGQMPVLLIMLYREMDPLPYPPTPGPNVGALFWLIATTGDGLLEELPAPVNLGIHYSRRDIQGMDPNRVTIGMLETDIGGWSPITSVPDPDARYVSATIRYTGIYAAYVR